MTVDRTTQRFSRDTTTMTKVRTRGNSNGGLEEPGLGPSARTRRRIRMDMNIFRYSPAKPALNNGRLQKSIKLAFVAHDSPITTKTAIEWCYPRAEPPYGWRYWAVKQALLRIGAKKLIRLGSVGRPWTYIWASNEEYRITQ